MLCYYSRAGYLWSKPHLGILNDEEAEDCFQDAGVSKVIITRLYGIIGN